MGPYAGVDYNLTLCRLQSRLQHIYHGQLYARVDLNRVDFIPQSATNYQRTERTDAQAWSLTEWWLGFPT
jgi:hypothetical protein